MTRKRRNHGKNRKGRGHVRNVRCMNCRRCVPKDKAIKRFQVRNMLDNASIRDVSDQCVYKGYQVPKLFIKIEYCVSCAIHLHIVRVRSVTDRRDRTVKRWRRPGMRDRRPTKPTGNQKQPQKPTTTNATPQQTAPTTTPTTTTNKV
ncbi:40S ribosomal protein S26 [Anaeramoeba ignava]|uniref:40S ribosomal protein S26 n=1 Tax=Anaeramoeba ignava TaxID=1746090 RepID=A0A9Q0LM31_ANAIG|nr:40S ribosomal protein S26 [Anaeramoeba ignava]|eukprot:Anaeramoba_ignava/a609558_514.p1 GENE.a609558_514~~a609558_514.p1  ORF type:complete len:147 (-),score=24.64 a609558_514:136-576(-)